MPLEGKLGVWGCPGAQFRGVTNLPFSLLRMLLQATPRPHQCDIKATSMRVASQAVATSKPLPCDLHATSMRPPCDPHATPLRPQSHHKARWKPNPADYRCGCARCRSIRRCGASCARSCSMAFSPQHRPAEPNRPCPCERGWPLLATCSPQVWQLERS